MQGPWEPLGGTILVDTSPDAEKDSDLIWGAIAGIRSDIERLTGRLERFAQAAGPDTGAAEEAAEAWKKEREKQLRAMRGDKGEELDDEDLEALERAWLSS